MLMDNGGGCVSCRTASEAGSSYLFDNNGKVECSCDVCLCSCSATFNREKRYQVALAAEMEKSKASSTTPSNTASLLGQVIANGIDNGILHSLQKDTIAAPHQRSKDVAAVAVQSIFSNQSFCSAKSIKDLQQAFGPIPSSVNNKSIQDLRKSGAELIAQQNERFLRNKLSSTAVTKPSPPGTSSHTAISITDHQSTDSSILTTPSLPTPVKLHLKFNEETSSVKGRRDRIRQSSLELKYDKSTSETDKEKAAKLIKATKINVTPTKDAEINEFIKDTIEMGLDTGDAKEMMIEELLKDE